MSAAGTTAVPRYGWKLKSLNLPWTSGPCVDWHIVIAPCFVCPRSKHLVTLSTSPGPSRESHIQHTFLTLHAFKPQYFHLVISHALSYILIKTCNIRPCVTSKIIKQQCQMSSVGRIYMKEPGLAHFGPNSIIPFMK